MQKSEDLRKRYAEIQSLLKIDLSNWDPRTRPSMEGMINKAKAEKDVVESKIGNDIVQKSVALFVLDDVEEGNKAVEDLISEQGDNVIGLDLLSIEKNIVENTLVNGLTFNNDSKNHLINILSEIGHDVGAIHMNMPEFKASYNRTYKDKKEALEGIKKILSDTYADDLKIIHTRRELIKKSLEKLEHEKLVFVFKNTSPSVANELAAIFGRNAVISRSSLDVKNAIKLTDKSTKDDIVEGISKIFSKKKKN